MTTQSEIAKIRHPRASRVFIECQSTANGVMWVCHTGIDYYLPEKFNSQAEAIAAVDAKLQANAETDASESAGLKPPAVFADPAVETITISFEAYEKFIHAVENPNPPNQALIDLMRGLKSQRGTPATNADPKQPEQRNDNPPPRGEPEATQEAVAWRYRRRDSLHGEGWEFQSNEPRGQGVHQMFEVEPLFATPSAVKLPRDDLIRWAQSKDPANIGHKTGEQWADEILSLFHDAGRKNGGEA